MTHEMSLKGAVVGRIQQKKQWNLPPLDLFRNAGIVTGNAELGVLPALLVRPAGPGVRYVSRPSADLCRLEPGEGGVLTARECGMVATWVITGASWRWEVAGRDGDREGLE